MQVSRAFKNNSSLQNLHVHAPCFGNRRFVLRSHEDLARIHGLKELWDKLLTTSKNLAEIHDALSIAQSKYKNVQGQHQTALMNFFKRLREYGFTSFVSHME